MIPPPPRSNHPDTLFPYTTRVRSPSRKCQLNASMAYLDSKFVDYTGAPCLAYETLDQCNSADPDSLAAHNIAGLPLQFAPKWSGNVGVKHEIGRAHV